MQLGRLC